MSTLLNTPPPPQPSATAIAARMVEMGRLARRGYATLIDWLTSVLFPAVVAYATHPLVVLATMLLLIPLVIFATLTAFVLVGNTYLNVCSAAVSSIVLMQSLSHHREVKRLHAEHGKQIAALHETVKALRPPPPAHKSHTYPLTPPPE